MGFLNEWRGCFFGLNHGISIYVKWKRQILHTHTKKNTRHAMRNWGNLGRRLKEVGAKKNEEFFFNALEMRSHNRDQN